MPETYGAHECRAYFVVEQTYGETPSNPNMLGINTENLEPVIEQGLIKVRGIGSRDLQSLATGLRQVRLKIPSALSSESPISLIQHVQTLSSLSIEVLYFKGLFSSPTDVISLLFKGCRLNRVDVECSVDDILRSSIECIGQNMVIGNSKIGASYGDFSGAVPYSQAIVKRGQGDGSNLQEITRVVEWKWSINNNLKPVPVLRSTTPYLLKYLPPRHRELSGELTFEFEATQEFQDVLDDAEFSLWFGLGGSYSALFKYCKWEEVSAPTKIEDLVYVKAKFAARDVLIS